LPERVSADPGGRVWAFERTSGGLRLIAFDADGERAVELPLELPGAPAQPPVGLGEGRIEVVAPGALLCVADGEIVWRVELPAGAPLATATARGPLLVRAGARVLAIGADGSRQWELTAPDEAAITSNVLVTGDGRVLFAAGETLHELAAA